MTNTFIQTAEGLPPQGIRIAENGREIAGPSAIEARIIALETANRFLAARNAALTRQLATLPAYLDELANQAGVFIGVATQAAITQRAAELRAVIAAEPVSPGGQG